MAKYGWTKGSGLGAESTGITSALRVKVDKGKGAGHGKILGGKKKKDATAAGKFGEMSEVIVLRGMLDGMDVGRELTEGNLVQEIGEECGEKVRRVKMTRQCVMKVWLTGLCSMGTWRGSMFPEMAETGVSPCLCSLRANCLL
jgi:hypothetical protein